MKLSNRQKQSAVLAAKAAGLSTEHRHMVQASILGVESLTADVDRHKFIRLMAYFEEHTADEVLDGGEFAVGGGRCPGFSPGYWAAEAARSNPASAILYKVRAEGRRLGMGDEDLDRFLASDRCSSGRESRITQAPVGWLVRLLEALKAIRQREEVHA
ncbi:MAG: hypothetical protein IMZ44_07605 [Planctomycetes bacterium]|nr:hypothetical protein [Planctomycetota bacterium]